MDVNRWLRMIAGAFVLALTRFGLLGQARNGISLRLSWD